MGNPLALARVGDRLDEEEGGRELPAPGICIEIESADGRVTAAIGPQAPIIDARPDEFSDVDKSP